MRSVDEESQASVQSLCISKVHVGPDVRFSPDAGDPRPLHSRNVIWLDALDLPISLQVNRSLHVLHVLV